MAKWSFQFNNFSNRKQGEDDIEKKEKKKKKTEKLKIYSNEHPANPFLCLYCSSSWNYFFAKKYFFSSQKNL